MRGPIVLMAGLGGLIAVELLMPAAPAAPAPIIPALHPAERRDVLPAAWAERLNASAAEILARPLFSLERRPPSITPQDVAIAPPPRLSGVISSRDAKLAIFADATDGKRFVIGTGERIGPYLLTDITSGTVTMIGPNGLHQLRLNFGLQIAKTTPAPAPKAAAPPTAPEPSPEALRQSSQTLVNLVLNSPSNPPR